ncbi:MAG: penicillin-binding protein activator [Candidatus Zixiibacteriota bacterium]
MIKRSILLIGLAFVCCLTTESGAQTIGVDSIRTAIEQAESLYVGGSFAEAASLFSNLTDLNPSYEGADRFRFMEAKSLYYAGEPDEASDLLISVLATEPPPFLQSACHYFLGRIAFDRVDYLAAAEELIRAFHLSDNQELRELLYQNCLNICSGYLSFSEQQQVLTTTHRIDPALFSDMVYRIASNYYDLGLMRRADRVIKLHAEISPRDGDTQIKRLQTNIESELSRSLDIALLVPLTGDLAPYGRQMDAAARLAVETFGTETVNISLKSYDTFGNSIVAAQLARDVTSSGVSVVVGPLTSQEAVGAAAYSDFWSVPMILPSASEKGLTSISRRIFQLTPTPETMGRRMAEAAMEELGLDSVAILSPNDNYGRQITEGFKQVLIANGVVVFDEVYYARGSSDFRRFMLNMKEKVLPDTFDTRIYLDNRGDTLEVEEIAVDIPAVFIPAYAEELKLIIPQLRFYRIRTIILGSEDLGDPDVASLAATKQYPAMFVSHATLTDADTSWQRFSYLFSQSNETEPTSVAGMTFDAIRIALRAAEIGGYSADGIALGLETLGYFDGVAGPLEFNELNENAQAPIYILLNGLIEKWRR